MSMNGLDPKVIGSIPEAVLKTLPAGTPPPGIQPNFTHPPTLVPVVLGVGIAFFVLAVLCFFVRIYTKLSIAKKWQWDDLTCSLGFMCSIVYFGTVLNGSINGSTGKHIWDLHLDKALNKSSLKQDYVTTIMATPALGLIKFSLFLQYYLLFRPLRWVRISVWIGATVSATFYVAVTITAFVLNSPWPGESLFDDILSWHYLEFAKFSIPTGVIGLIVDWYLLILPIPAVLTLQMSMAKKLGVLIIFATGGLAAIASIITLYYRVQLQNHPVDPTWRASYVLLWAQIEMFAGVTASSMPTVSKFFSRQKFSIVSWGSSLKSNIKHLISSSMREKLPDDNPTLTDWSGRNTHTAEASKAYRMEDLESGGREHNATKSPWMENSRIHLTQEVFITQE